MLRHLGCSLALALAVCAEPPFAGPTTTGQLAAPPNNEASGLAASRRTPGLLWIHDDSGGEPVLYGVGFDGRLRGRLRVLGAKNVDWEDIAAGEIDHKPCLVIGDTGDNNENRHNIVLHLVEEPPAEKLSPGREFSAAPLATLHVTYEHGPRDCEALAFDEKERAIYLLTKRDKIPRLYRVDLPAELKNGPVRARFQGIVPGLPPPSRAEKLIKGPLGKHRSWPTAMDFAPDGSGAVVLTYGDVCWFERRPGEAWPDALARPPVLLTPHGLPQAEAACFSADGARLFVASEQTRKLLRYDRR